MTSRLLCRLLQHMAELTLLLNCMLAIALASDEPKLSGDVEPPKAPTSVPVMPTSFYRDLTSVLADRGVQVAPSPSSAWRVERDIRLNASLNKLTVDSALPRRLVVAAIFRPERENGTLFAVRGPGGRIKFGLSYSVSASSPSEPPRLEMRLWSEATASAAGSAQRPAAVLTDVKPGFRLGVSIISFYVYLDRNWLSYEFWCPGEPFWSINPEYGQRVPSLDSGTQHQIQFPAGSTLHLLSDGVDNFFRGDIARLLLASPVPEHSQRRWLKCQSGLGDVSPIIPATRGLPSPRPPPPEFSALSSSGDTSPQTDWLPKEMTTTLDAIDRRTTTVASILPVAVRTSLKGEKGERGLPGLPGVCTEKCPGAVGQDSRLELQPPATAQPGAKGEPGPPGPKGAAGPAGSKGDAGRVGEKGDVGPEGPRGNAGPAGPMGEVGPPGSFGERGPIGPKGDIGLPGSKGERGLTGTAGPPGARGEPGPKGLPGSTGEPGSPGAPGPPGPPGESMRVESTDSPATVRGEKGEKGDKGDKGDRGDRGDRGDPGMRGQVGPPGREGPSGSVGPVGPPAAKGSKGEPGRSCDCTETRNAEPQRPQPPALVMTPEFPATSGVRVISSHEIFSQIGHTLPEGALVYAKDRSALFLKTDFDSNAWIEILTGGRSSGMAFPTSTTPATTPTLKPEIFLPNAITGPRLRLVALPFKLYGDLKYKRAFSNLAADYACQDAARSAGLSSVGDSARKVHFRAFLNGLYSTVETLVRANQRNSVPIVNLHSQKLFENYSDMLNRGVWNSEVQLQDFAGRNLSQWTENLGVSEILAWRGLRHRDLGMPDCEGFFSRSVLQTGLATDLKSGRLLQSDRKMACDSPLIVLCIEARTWLN